MKPARLFIRNSESLGPVLTRSGCAYADWANKIRELRYQDHSGRTRSLSVTSLAREDLVDAHDEVSMYWGWAFTWDGAPRTLSERTGASFHRNRKAAQARRHVDCVLADERSRAL